MRRRARCLSAVAGWCACAAGSVPAQAQAQVTAAGATPGAASSLLQVLFGLVAVLALMAAAAWLLRRYTGSRAAGNGAVRIVGGVSVGNRERVLVLEVGEQWLVVGVGAGRVNALATLPRQIESPETDAPAPPATAVPVWLQQFIERRNASQ